jgi:hypothetical protein
MQILFLSSFYPWLSIHILPLVTHPHFTLGYPSTFYPWLPILILPLVTRPHFTLGYPSTFYPWLPIHVLPWLPIHILPLLPIHILRSLSYQNQNSLFRSSSSETRCTSPEINRTDDYHTFF